MSDYKLNHGSSDLYQVDGSSITTSSTKVKSGAAKGLGSDQTLLDNVNHGYEDGQAGTKPVGGNDLGSAAWGASVSVTSVASGANGYCEFTLTSHGRSIGDVINITDTNGIVNGPQRITAAATNTFTTTKLFASGAGTLAYRLQSGNFGIMTAEKYVIRGISDELAGISNTVLRSPASSKYRRKFNEKEVVRTRKVTTSIRNGDWNIYSASFDTAPSTSEDMSLFETNGQDNETTTSSSRPWSITFRDGSANPINKDGEADPSF